MVPEFDAQEINSFKMGQPRSPKMILIDALKNSKKMAI